MSKKTMPMRLAKDIQYFINMLAGEYQHETGKNVSASEALRRLANEAKPSLMKRATELAKQEGDDSDEE